MPVNISGCTFIIESLNPKIHGNGEFPRWHIVPVRYKHIVYHFLISPSYFSMLELEVSNIVPSAGQYPIVSQLEKLSKILGNMRDFLRRFMLSMVQGAGFNRSEFPNDFQELLEYQCRMRVADMIYIASRLDSSCEESVDQ